MCIGMSLSFQRKKTIKRQFIPLEKLDIYDQFHYQSGDSFEVNEKLDGKNTEYHKQGIEVIKGVLAEGKKVLPILVLKEGDRYKLLDGFKRSRAHIESGYSLIEAFVCDQIDERGICLGEIRCFKGGQSEMSMFENGAENEQILYWSGDVEKLRIELAENIHVHWGSYGKNRLSLSKAEFKELAHAISKI